MKHFLSLLLILIICSAGHVFSQTYVDNFDTAVNYMDGLGGTVWDGLMAYGGGTIVQCNSISNAGQLTYSTTLTDNNQLGMFYINVPADNDFDARLKITGGDFQSWTGHMPWHSCGLVALRNETNWMWNICFDHTEWDATYMLRSYLEGVEDTTGTACGGNGTIVVPYQRLERIGNDYIGYYSSNGVDWIEWHRYNRPDMAATPLMVGIAHAMFDVTTTGQSILDDFSLHVIPEPGSILLLASGILFAGLRRR